jgi:hypothetical protein
MHSISNQHFDFVREIISDYIAQNKDAHDLALYNRVRRARLMLRTWERNKAHGKERR